MIKEKTTTKNKRGISWGGVFVSLCLSALLWGCQNDTGETLWDQITQLNTEKDELKQQVGRLESENTDLTEQVENLSVMSGEVRLEAIPALKSVVIGRRSGLFDKDKDGIKEKLIVYVQPLDETGDSIKAAGKVEVELWDLNADSAEAMLGKWEVEPAELKMLWAKTMSTNHYRLTFDVAELLEEGQEELTIKVEFTDYTRGKILRDQKVIEP